jgi:hypothetical protein
MTPHFNNHNTALRLGMWQLWGMTTLLANSNDVKILGLFRYPVKGMNDAMLDQVKVDEAETSPDNRRYALLYKTKEENWTNQTQNGFTRKTFFVTCPHRNVFRNFER